MKISTHKMLKEHSPVGKIGKGYQPESHEYMLADNVCRNQIIK